jgi:mannosyltransferase
VTFFCYRGLTLCIKKVSFIKPGNAEPFVRYLLFGIIVAGAILRLLQIGSKSLWLDESFSIWLGRHTVPEMLSWLVRIDQHPPLYYILLHFWMSFGDSAATVRALSALFGTLNIPVLYLLGRRLIGRSVGLLAALILTISPFHVRFAQETRMYTLLTLNASLALLALAHLLTDPRAATVPLGQQLFDFCRAWRTTRTAEAQTRGEAGDGYQKNFCDSGTWVSTPTRRRWPSIQTIETDLAWLGYMVFTTATVLSHNTAVFFPIAVNLFVFGLVFVRQRWPRSDNTELLQPPSLKNWLTAQLGTFLLWGPWLAAFIVQAERVYHEFWISAPTFKTVVGTIKTFLSAFLPGKIKWADAIWAAYGLIALMGVVHLRKRLAHLVLVLILFLTPFLGELLVSLRRPIFYDRTLIWASIPVFLLLAAGLNLLRYRPYILVGVAILAIVNGLSLREYYIHFEKEQWDDAAAYVGERVETEDVILFNATWVQIPFDFYFRDYGWPMAEYGVPVDLFDRGILEPKMAKSDLPRLRSLIRDRKRVWLVYSHNWYTDPQSLIPRALEKELELMEKKRFYGLEVHLYGVP